MDHAMAYIFHQDPGHGWLAVPVVELYELGIAAQVSEYSYLSRDGKTAYLEEDCDLSVFARAKGWAPGGHHPITDSAADGGWIRNLGQFGSFPA